MGDTLRSHLHRGLGVGARGEGRDAVGDDRVARQARQALNRSTCA